MRSTPPPTSKTPDPWSGGGDAPGPRHEAAQFIISQNPSCCCAGGFGEVDRVYRLTARHRPPPGALLARRPCRLGRGVGARLFITYLFNPRTDLDLAVVDDARVLVGRSCCPHSSRRRRPIHPLGVTQPCPERRAHRPRRDQRSRGHPRVSNNDMEATIRTVKDNADAIFTWTTRRGAARLNKLYEKAKVSQWNGETDLDWSIEVDQEEVAATTSSSTAVWGDRARRHPVRQVGREGVAAAGMDSRTGASASSCTASRA